MKLKNEYFTPFHKLPIEKRIKLNNRIRKDVEQLDDETCAYRLQGYTNKQLYEAIYLLSAQGNVSKDGYDYTLNHY